MRVFSQGSDPSQLSETSLRRGWHRIAPSLVIFASAVGNKIVLAFEPFSALNAIPLPQTRKIFRSLGQLVLRQMFRRFEILVDLVQVSGEIAKLVSPTHDYSIRS